MQKVHSVIFKSDIKAVLIVVLRLGTAFVDFVYL